MSENKDIATQKMNNAIAILDEYEKKCGLPPTTQIGSEEELQNYLNMDRNVVEKLSVEDCGNIAYRLKQYSFYIQRLHNKESSREAWVVTQLNDEVAKRIHGYDKYLKYSNKVALIAKDDSYVAVLYKIYSYTKQRVKRLTFLSNSIKDLADTLLSIQRAKLYMLKGQ
jgi:hypothetical protein